MSHQESEFWEDFEFYLNQHMPEFAVKNPQPPHTTLMLPHQLSATCGVSCSFADPQKFNLRASNSSLFNDLLNTRKTLFLLSHPLPKGQG